MRKKHSSLPFLSRLLTLCLIIFLISFAWFKYLSRPTQKGSTVRVNFAIAQGEGPNSIARRLIDKKLIHSLPAFRLEILLSNKAKKIQAGDFVLNANMDLPTIVEALTHGTTDRWVTFLEGWRREEFAQALVDALSESNKDYAFNQAEFLSLTKNLEGQLAPNTYSFTKSTTAQAAVDRLTKEHQKNILGLENNSGLSDAQVLILASLVERESRVSSERPIVAGVLLKRLKQGWPLQVDATVQFVMANINCKLLTCDWWPQNITRGDLSINSPYNTYANQGLPPAPISSPSIDSLKAAYNPKDSDYWFYLHDPKGQIHFAKTIEEHNQNVARFLGK